MIILNLTVTQGGFLYSVKSYYCNVADKSQVPESEIARIEIEYCKTIRNITAASEEAWSNTQLLDKYSWYYSDNKYDIVLKYSDETEQIYPHL